ncbi:unnamed protein product [Sphagnum balticum]
MKGSKSLDSVPSVVNVGNFVTRTSEEGPLMSWFKPKVDNSNSTMKVREVSRSSELSLTGKLVLASQEPDRQQNQLHSRDVSSCGLDGYDELELLCADMKVEEVISPTNPGSAVCQGAAALSVNKNGIT